MYVLAGEWDGYTSIAAARPKMAAILDGVRDLLEEFGDGLGVTDPVSGEVILEPKPKKKPAGAAKEKTDRKGGLAGIAPVAEAPMPQPRSPGFPAQPPVPDCLPGLDIDPEPAIFSHTP